MDSILVGQCRPFYSEFVGRTHFCVCRGERASRMAKVRKRHEFVPHVLNVRFLRQYSEDDPDINPQKYYSPTVTNRLI